MRVLIAPDAFKGSLSAAEAAEAMAAGIRDAIPDAGIVMLPLADGGEGTMDALISYVIHEENNINIDNKCIYIDEHGENVALIESAHWLGLNHPAMQATDVRQRGSGTLGEVIRGLLDEGIRRFVIGLGGSATNEGGLGLLAALGLRALDGQGRNVSPDLQGLFTTSTLDMTAMDARLADCHLTILTDVDAPLCGAEGATFTFGPQKGLPEDSLGPVDQAMAGFASLAEATFGRSACEMPGSGAAGGLGFAFALLGGQLVSGADYVIAKAGLAGKLAGCDWVLTGEGRSDAQTLAGKLPLKVAVLSRDAGVRVALISGDVADGSMLTGTFDAVISARPQGMAVETAMAQAGVLLRQAACRWAKRLSGR
jgi:glycerate 2-kinase